MTNAKLFGILVTLLLVISFFILAGSLANPISYATPTPTPEPTATPTPTPRPEPTAKPTLEIYCRSTAATGNLKIDVTGTLTYNKTAIRNSPVYIGFSADYGNKWENFTLVQTGSDGGFAAVWTPNATGNYLMCAQWGGNNTLHWVNATANLALTEDLAGNVFSVGSNSTISNLAYNSTTEKLSFMVNGTSGTTGLIYASIPKALVSDIQALSVNKDGKPTAYGSESREEAWVISCVYSEGEHAFSMQLPFQEMLGSQAMPWVPIAVTVIAVLIAVIAAVVTIRRRRRTAATVASILKENRRSY